MLSLNSRSERKSVRYSFSVFIVLKNDSITELLYGVPVSEKDCLTLNPRKYALKVGEV